MPPSDLRKRPHIGHPYSCSPHAPTSVISTHDGKPRPNPVASHHHHLPRPEPPHPHLATQVEGYLRGPHPRTPKPHMHPPHAPPGERNGPGAARPPQPRVVGVLHAHKPTGSGGHQVHPIHPADACANRKPQHPTRLHHFMGIPRPRNSHSLARSPPPWTRTPPPSSKPRQRWPPQKPGAHGTWLRPKWRQMQKATKNTQRRNHSTPNSNSTQRGKTAHDEWAARYIVRHNTTCKNNATKITVTRHLPNTTQVCELTALNVLNRPPPARGVVHQTG